MSNDLFYSLSTTHLNVADIPAMGKKSQNIVIKNVGKRNLEIPDVQVFDSAIGVQLKKRILKPGAKTNLKITVYGQQLKKLKRTPRVMIITNDPNRPKIIVNVKATSK